MADGQAGETADVPAQMESHQEHPVMNQPLETFPVECPEGEHALQTPWSWWFDKKPKASPGCEISEEEFKANLKRIGTVHSVEQFATYYRHCKKPLELATDCNLHLFRYKTYPMWEPFPRGGCWLIKIASKNLKVDHKSPGSANWMWERLLFATIGEVFSDPDMIGVSLSVRPKGIVLSVWNLNDTDSQSNRFAIGEKLREIVQLPQYATIEYKLHGMSMKDRSSFRNARPYLIVAAEPSHAPSQAPAMQLPPAAMPAANISDAPSSKPNPNAAAWAPPAAAWVPPATSEAAAPAEDLIVAEEEEEAPEDAAPAAAQAEEDAPAESEDSDKEPTKLSFAEMAKRSQGK